MSPEAVLPVATGPSPSPSAAPSPAPASAAALGAGPAGGNSAGGCASGAAAASPSAGTASSPPSGDAPQQTSSSAANRCASQVDGGKTGNSAAQGTRAGGAHPGAPAAAAAAAGGSQNFSATLAQSLATPSRSVAVRPGKPAKTAAAAGPDKAGKSDPVSAAMAMVRQAVPITPVLPTININPGMAGKPAGSAPSAQSALAGAVSAAAHGGQRTALQVGVLAVTGEDAAHSAQGTSTAAASAGASSASAVTGAAALTAGQVAAGTTAAAQTPAAASAVLSAPVGSGGWTGQLGAQLTWMARQGVQSASLQVTPQHLGPVQVSISVRHGQASVWFGAAQPETRQALNQALPELRAMFADQGLALTDSGVSHEAPREPRRSVRPAVSAVGEVGAVEEGAGVGVLAGIGLVDTYA